MGTAGIVYRMTSTSNEDPKVSSAKTSSTRSSSVKPSSSSSTASDVKVQKANGETKKQGNSIWFNSKLFEDSIAGKSLSEHTEIENNVENLKTLLFNLDYDKFISELDQLRKEHPEVPHYTALAADYYLEKGDLNSAKTELENLLQVMPTNSFAEEILATIERNQGNFQQSLEHFENILSQDPNRDSSVSGLVSVYASQGKTEEGLQKVQDLANKYPNSAALANAKADVLALTGKSEEVENLVEENFKKFPDNVGARGRMIALSFKKGEYQEAIRLGEIQLSDLKNPEEQYGQLAMMTEAARLMKDDKLAKQYQAKMDKLADENLIDPLR